MEVPLFTELYGYGHFASRRNTGVYEPLYCRAFTFYDGRHRAVIVYSDLCTTDDQFARELRAQIATRLRIRPEGIASYERLFVKFYLRKNRKKVDNQRKMILKSCFCLAPIRVL